MAPDPPQNQDAVSQMPTASQRFRQEMHNSYLSLGESSFTSSSSSTTTSNNSKARKGSAANASAKKHWPMINLPSRPLQSLRHRRHVKKANQNSNNENNTIPRSSSSLYLMNGEPISTATVVMDSDVSSSTGNSKPICSFLSRQSHNKEVETADSAEHDVHLLSDDDSSLGGEEIMRIDNNGDNQVETHHYASSEPSSDELTDHKDDDHQKDLVQICQCVVNLADDDNSNEISAVNQANQEVGQIDDYEHNHEDQNEEEEIQSEWSCPRCTLLNPLQSSHCEVCQYQHSADVTVTRSCDVSDVVVSTSVNNQSFDPQIIRPAVPSRRECLINNNGIVAMSDLNYNPNSSSSNQSDNNARNYVGRGAIGLVIGAAGACIRKRSVQDGATEDAVSGAVGGSFVDGVMRDNGDNFGVGHGPSAGTLLPEDGAPTVIATRRARSGPPRSNQISPSIPSSSSMMNGAEEMKGPYRDILYHGPLLGQQNNHFSPSESSSQQQYQPQRSLPRETPLDGTTGNERHRYTTETIPSSDTYNYIGSCPSVSNSHRNRRAIMLTGGGTAEHAINLEGVRNETNAIEGEVTRQQSILLNNGAGSDIAYQYLHSPTTRRERPQVIGATQPTYRSSPIVGSAQQYHHHQQQQQPPPTMNNLDTMCYERLLEVFGDGTENIRGAPASTINSLPECIINDAKKDLPVDKRQCMICLEEFVDGDRRKVMPCFHGFHVECVVRWLKNHATCPICKHAV